MIIAWSAVSFHHLFMRWFQIFFKSMTLTQWCNETYVRKCKPRISEETEYKTGQGTRETVLIDNERDICGHNILTLEKLVDSNVQNKAN